MGLAGDLRDCHACELRGEFEPVPGEGRGRLMIILEAPGREEMEAGSPSVGRTSGAVDRLLEEIDLKRSEVRLTNALKCPLPRSREPLDRELVACQEWLDAEIRLYKPWVILAMGKTVARVLIDRERVEVLRNRAWVYHAIPVIVTYHPMVWMRFPELRDKILADMRVVKRKLKRFAMERSGRSYSANEWMLA